MIEAQLEALLGREGGYVNHPADRGGPTNFGITEAVARQHGYKGDMRNLPRDEAKAIYRRLYWERPRYDSVAERCPKLAAELFDTGVNMGPSVASSFLQRALNALNRQERDYEDIVADGRIGAKTLAALDGYFEKRGYANGAKVLLRLVDALQGERYLRIAERNPSQEAFLYGWIAHRTGGH